MPKISVEVPVTWGTYLSEILEALRAQTFQDYEVCVASSLKEDQHKDLLESFGAKFTSSGPNLLEKRYRAHQLCRGEYSLLLDETRVPHRMLLERLALHDEDMVIINEGEARDGFWEKAAHLDKLLIQKCPDLDFTKGYILPRYFRSTLLTMAFENVKKKIGDKKFVQVLMEDHQLISYEASLLSNRVAIINDILIMHYGDRTLSEILSKYHRYGRHHRVLKGTPYEFMLNLLKRSRRTCKDFRLSWPQHVQLMLLYLARGIPFAIGYYIW